MSGLVGGPEEYFRSLDDASDEVAMHLEKASQLAETYFGESATPRDIIDLARMIQSTQRISALKS